MNVITELRQNLFLKKVRKSILYSRLRQYFPQPAAVYVDDCDLIEKEDAEIILMDWPAHIQKPKVGLVRDFGHTPRWTKYVGFLDNNKIPYELYDIQRNNWIEEAAKFDAIIGILSNLPFHLDEARCKIQFLERHLGKVCYPSTDHINLYENKRLEAYLCRLHGFPFAKTYLTYDKDEAIEIADSIQFPVVSKIDPSSGSLGVELIRNRKHCRTLIEKAFSNNGRKIHLEYFRQKNYIYLQEFIPNDGYDIRVIISGDFAFGYYRKAPVGDFRASGMKLESWGQMPDEAVIIARKLYRVIASPQLVVDFVHGNDGQFHIVEYSPFCQVDLTSELIIDGVKGAYKFDTDETYHFEKRRLWVHDLALREFFTSQFLSGLSFEMEKRKFVVPEISRR